MKLYENPGGTATLQRIVKVHLTYDEYSWAKLCAKELGVPLTHFLEQCFWNGWEKEMELFETRETILTDGSPEADAKVRWRERMTGKRPSREAQLRWLEEHFKGVFQKVDGLPPPGRYREPSWADRVEAAEQRAELLRQEIEPPEDFESSGIKKDED